MEGEYHEVKVEVEVEVGLVSRLALGLHLRDVCVEL